MKKCCRCNETLSFEAFSKNKGNKDGFFSYCKACMKTYTLQRNSIPANTKQSINSTKNYRLNNIALGKCRFCPKERILHSNRYCEWHHVADIAASSLKKSNNKVVDELLKKLKENPICPYTGEFLVLGLNAHLDHILSKKNHPELISEVNNVEWISERANFAKDSLDKEDFIQLCKLICSRF